MTEVPAIRQYLFWCANEHIDFRVPEFKSVASLLNISLKWLEEPMEEPYLLLELGSEKEARAIAERCMLVKACYELWGTGRSTAQLHASLLANHPAFAHHLAPDRSFCVRVEAYNSSMSAKQKLEKIESLSFLNFEGPVSLKAPDTLLKLFEYYGLKNTEVPEHPYRHFLGRHISDGGRGLIAKYSLKDRSYIGSTSMDAQLAFIMANMARVENGSLVMDPFVGTGSILVSSACFGGYTLGSDIDILTVHARTKPTRAHEKARADGESIGSNMRQYGLGGRHVDVAVVDCASSAWRPMALLDAIITDPPYGIREATARVGRATEEDSVKQAKKDKKQRKKQRRQMPGGNGVAYEGEESEKAVVSGGEANERGVSCEAEESEKDGAVSKEGHLSRVNGVTNGCGRLLITSRDGGAATSQVTSGSGVDDKFTEDSVVLSASFDTGGTQKVVEEEVVASKECTAVGVVRGDNRQLPGPPVHYPAKTAYRLCDVFRDLLQMAAHHLRVGGRLVYWMPVNRAQYTPALVPSHPCLCLRHNIEQVLNTHSSRRLIVMVKTRQPRAGEAAASSVQPLAQEFRLAFFEGAQLTRQQRLALKPSFTRDKRGQSLRPRESGAICSTGAAESADAEKLTS